MKEKIEKGLIKPLSLSSSGSLESSDGKSKKKTKEPLSESAISKKEEKEILKDLQHWIPDLPQELGIEILHHLLGTFIKIKEELSKSLFLADVSDRKLKSEGLEEAFEKLFVNFQLFQKGNTFFAEEEAILDKYLVSCS